MGPIFEVDLSRIDLNLKVYRGKVGEAKICAVVKANAYGFGIEGIGRFLDPKVDYFGVARVEEAVILREAGIKKPIIVLGYVTPSEFKDVISCDITASVKSLDVAKSVSTEARRADKVAKVHVEVETGMHRLGVLPENGLFFVQNLLGLPNLKVEGIYSHFIDGDRLEGSEKQFAVLQSLIEELKSSGIDLPLKHIAASKAASRFSHMQLDMVRLGGGLYGFPLAGELQFAGKLSTHVTNLTLIKKGETVGYDFGFRASGDTLVATLAIGYGDGFRRTPHHFDEVLIGGKRAKIIGIVAMDQVMVDVTHLPQTGVGDEVVVIGKQKEAEITVEEVADKLGTNLYEVTSALTSRVKRIYKN